MKTYLLSRRQRIARPAEEVFAFFENPSNLGEITPDSVGFKMLTPTPFKMMTGAILDYTIKVLGIQVRWTTIIAEYNPPVGFKDTALRGPYSFWHHTHRFKSENESETVMEDEVHYALPFGVMGRLVNWLWVRRQLDYIFDYRAEKIDSLLESEKVSEDDVSRRK